MIEIVLTAANIRETLTVKTLLTVSVMTIMSIVIVILSVMNASRGMKESIVVFATTGISHCHMHSQRVIISRGRKLQPRSFPFFVACRVVVVVVKPRRRIVASSVYRHGIAVGRDAPSSQRVGRGLTGTVVTDGGGVLCSTTQWLVVQGSGRVSC